MPPRKGNLTPGTRPAPANTRCHSLSQLKCGRRPAPAGVAGTGDLSRSDATASCGHAVETCDPPGQGQPSLGAGSEPPPSARGRTSARSRARGKPGGDPEGSLVEDSQPTVAAARPAGTRLGPRSSVFRSQLWTGHDRRGPSLSRPGTRASIALDTGSTPASRGR